MPWTRLTGLFIFDWRSRLTTQTSWHGILVSLLCEYQVETQMHKEEHCVVTGLNTSCRPTSLALEASSSLLTFTPWIFSSVNSALDLAIMSIDVRGPVIYATPRSFTSPAKLWRLSRTPSRASQINIAFPFEQADITLASAPLVLPCQKKVPHFAVLSRAASVKATTPQCHDATATVDRCSPRRCYSLSSQSRTCATSLKPLSFTPPIFRPVLSVSTHQSTTRTQATPPSSPLAMPVLASPSSSTTSSHSSASSGLSGGSSFAMADGSAMDGGKPQARAARPPPLALPSASLSFEGRNPASVSRASTPSLTYTSSEGSASNASSPVSIVRASNPPESPSARGRRSPPSWRSPPAIMRSAEGQQIIEIALPRPGGQLLSSDNITISVKGRDRLNIVADAWHLERDCHFEWSFGFASCPVDMSTIRAKIQDDADLVVTISELRHRWM